MPRLPIILALALIAAPLPASAQQQRLIPLIDGRTCWTETSMRCFRYNANNRTATRAGFGDVQVSPQLEEKPGFITEAGFVAIERAISKQVGGQIHGRW